jgi:uncharacterized protein (DUF849 family)
MQEKTIINFCPTGMVPVKKQTPYVPVSPAEIIEQVHQASTLGITIAHLHARGEDELPVYQKYVYRDIFEGVRKYCPDLIICGSTSGRTFPEFEKRSEVIELGPDMCSLTLSSLNFIGQASINTPDMILRLAEKMNEFGVKQELECFDLGMINYGKYLVKKGVLKPPFYWNLIFGNMSGFQATLSHVSCAVQEISGEHDYVSLGAVGLSQLNINAMAISNGYGVRVGIEDNIWYDQQRTRKASNLALLERIHMLMDIHEKKLMTSAELGNRGFYNTINHSYHGADRHSRL